MQKASLHAPAEFDSFRRSHHRRRLPHSATVLLAIQKDRRAIPDIRTDFELNLKVSSEMILHHNERQRRAAPLNLEPNDC